MPVVSRRKRANQSNMSSEEKKSLVSSQKSSNNENEPQLWGRYNSLFLARWIPNYGAHASLEEAWGYFENITLP